MIIKKERGDMTGNNELVELMHTVSRINKIKTKHLDIAAKLKEKCSTKTRIITDSLPSGNELALITNLPLEYDSQEIENLYFKSWKIEKKYHTLKNKMKFESVTGKATIYVYQDFWAQLVIYNMIQDVRHAADERLNDKVSTKNYKNPVHVNENMAVGLFKEEFIKILIEQNERLRERKHNLSNKYKNNQKNSF